MSKADSIKMQLKNIAKKEHKQFDYLLMLYMIERLLYRISISNYSNLFVLKGGLLLYTILDEKARATKDIDLLAIQLASTLDSITDIFKEICLIKSDDAIDFDISSITGQRIKEDADYEGVRIKVTAYIDKSRKVLQLDIGFGDVVIPRPVNMEYPSILDMERPKLKVYSLESVISEKFEAMVYLANANSRMKDFYDIYSLSNSFNFNGEVLYTAISETFKRRNTPLFHTPIIFSKEFESNDDKNIQWNAFRRRIKSDFDVSFDEIICAIRVFLQPIYKALMDESEFKYEWNCQKCIWETEDYYII